MNEASPFIIEVSEKKVCLADFNARMRNKKSNLKVFKLLKIREKAKTSADLIQKKSFSSYMRTTKAC